MFQDTTKPIVVSTLGTHITDETMALFKGWVLSTSSSPTIGTPPA